MLVLLISILLRPTGEALHAQTLQDDMQRRLQVRLEDLREAGGYPGLSAAIVMMKPAK